MTRFLCLCTNIRWANKKHTKKMAKGKIVIGTPCDRQDFQIRQLCIALFLENV
jgi:hypothetical protein